MCGRRASDHIYICNKCGTPIDLHNYAFDLAFARQIKEKSLCYQCSYWLELLENPLPHHQVINRQYFVFPPEDNPEEKKHYILTFDGNVIVTTGLYNYGPIPERFWDDFPNTATFITYRRYKMLMQNQEFVCDRKGCWDRSRCYWYVGVMDWNEIPDYHITGTENCPMFIDTYNPKK